MFVSKKLVYLQMQKAGSTHATRVLKTFVGGNAGMRHGKIEKPEQFSDRLIFSSVRNPWDWYVSLYSFGCAGSGGFQKYMHNLPISEFRQALAERHWPMVGASVLRGLSNPLRGRKYRRLYSDANNTENFREWLKLLLGPEGQYLNKEGYGTSRIKTSVGFMTYRFLALTTDYRVWNSEGRSAGSLSEVIDFADKHTIAKRIMRTETLNEELLDVMTSAGVKVSMEDLEKIGKTNQSKHLKYDAYYDQETHRLVAERDRFIIDRFDYKLF